MQPAQHACPAAQLPAPQRGIFSYFCVCDPFSQGLNSACFLFAFCPCKIILSTVPQFVEYDSEQKNSNLSSHSRVIYEQLKQ
jgi:hypothetical protein